VSRLADIAVRVEGAPAGSLVSDGGLGGGVTAILSELAALLEQLVEINESATIDVRSLPMSPDDRVRLKAALGDGEVQATVNAQGISVLRESSIPGIWWVEHRDEHGEVVVESLEVTRIPAFLMSAPDEIRSGVRALREKIAATTQTGSSR
jgi:hydrogenase-1 operon protein HyaF